MGTETTQIIDLNAAEGKAVQEGEKGWNLLGKLYDGALEGIRVQSLWRHWHRNTYRTVAERKNRQLSS